MSLHFMDIFFKHDYHIKIVLPRIHQYFNHLDLFIAKILKIHLWFKLLCNVHVKTYDAVKLGFPHF